jgi:hypothetical protein
MKKKWQKNEWEEGGMWENKWGKKRGGRYNL